MCTFSDTIEEANEGRNLKFSEAAQGVFEAPDPVIQVLDRHFSREGVVKFEGSDSVESISERFLVFTESEFIRRVLGDSSVEDNHYAIAHNEDHIVEKAQDVLGAVSIVPVEGNVYVLTKG